jgi:cytochrome c oxidase cbb3-type subunit II
MKGLVSLFIGVFGTFAFSWVGLTVIPSLQIGALNPQMDEEGTDTYPAPKSGMAERGRRVYAANGCIYCHSQQVRPDYAASDIDRKWGERRSAPRDYLFDRPVLLGQERMGPDLSNVGKRAPAEGENSPSTANAPVAPPAGAASPPAAAGAPPAKPPIAGSPPPPATAASPAGAPPAPSPAAPAVTPQNPNGQPPAYSEAWHHRHLYSPRSLNGDSNMPAYKFLYEKHQVGGERSADALQLTGSEAPSSGWEIVPSYDAKCLVAYLMSLDQSHPLKEVKSAAAPAAPPAASPPPAAPPK